MLMSLTLGLVVCSPSGLQDLEGAALCLSV